MKKSLRVIATPCSKGSALRGLFSNCKEAGCIRYDLTRGLGKPAEFAFIEEWESGEHLDAHLQTAHVQEAGGKAGPLLGAPPSIERYRQIG